MRIPDPSQGFTLLELMIVIAVVAILVTIGTPSFQFILDKNRLKGAAEELVQQLQLARAEAIKQNKQVQVVFKKVTGETDWCYGLDDTSNDCDCQADPTNCTINTVEKVVTQASAKGVVIEGNLFGVADDTSTLIFDPVRGTVSVRDPDDPLISAPPVNDYVEFKSAKGRLAHVVISSALGRATICSPIGAGNIGDYSDC